MRVRYLRKDYKYMVEEQFPSIAATGSVKGMKEKYWGADALCVKCGSFIYNVTSKPEIYYNYAH